MTRRNEIEAYASEAMLERRRRILVEARALIIECGVAGLTLSELGQRAGVAKQTLYYAYGSKEAVVSAAILDYFEEYEARIPYRAAHGTIDRLIERLVGIGERNLGIPNYVAELIRIYYDGSPDLWQAMFSLAARPHESVAEALYDTGRLQEGVVPSQLVEAMVGQTVQVSSSWLKGRIGDGELIDRLVLGVLELLAGVGTTAIRADIDRIIAEVRQHGARGYLASPTVRSTAAASLPNAKRIATKPSIAPPMVTIASE